MGDKIAATNDDKEGEPGELALPSPDHPQWDVDICATILSDAPPTLPLREELNSLGFEVVLGGSGTGVRASKYESKKAVEAFRKELQIHDLKKRRLFPKSNSKILQKIQHRQDVEHEIALPHACSYETYETKLRRALQQAFDSDDDDSHSFSGLHTTKPRTNSLFLAPDASSPRQNSPPPVAEAAVLADQVPDVFGAFDNLEYDDMPTTETTGGGGGVFDTILQALSGSEPDPEPSWVREPTDVESSTTSQPPTNPFADVPVASNPFETDSQAYLQDGEEKKEEEPLFHGVPSPQKVVVSESTDPCQAAMAIPDLETALSIGSGALDLATEQIYQVTTAMGATTENHKRANNNKASAEELPAPSTTDNPKNPAAAWISSATHAIGAFSSDVFHKVTHFQKTDDKQPSPNVLPLSEEDAVSTIFSALQQPGVPLKEIKNLLKETPDLPQLRQESDGRLPLHALCARELKDRSHLKRKKLTDQLLDDLTSHRQIIELVVKSFPYACTLLDKNGDLPVHLMARGLMVWEATWYEAVYKAAAKDKETNGGTTAEITKLYHGMSKTIELLMQPIVQSSERDLFLSPGSMGTIYLLHIATIFTVSVKTLRQVLEAYPEAAKTRCDLGILRTFVPDECIPLELHEGLSTDYPKWETDANEKHYVASQEDDDENTIRRSDLLFAYNPIEPHRFEKSRIRRFELRIQFDAAIMVGKATRRLEAANERIWIWFCTFSEADNGKATYAHCVKRIANVLSIQAIQCLAKIETPDGKKILEAANSECAHVIERRLRELGGVDEIPSVSVSLLQRQSAFISHVCHLIFNIPKTAVPTSFIILPYRLQKDSEGNLQLQSPDMKEVAKHFAQCLVQFTEPQSIVDCIHTKIFNHSGLSMFEGSSDDDQHEFSLSRLRDLEKSFLKLYKEREGYLYLVDEMTGLPRVSEESKYPIVLSSSRSYVRKLLPLMMVGMVQMRGETAFPRLVAVLAEKGVTRVPPTWIEAHDCVCESQRLQDYSGLYQDDTTNTLDMLKRHSESRLPLQELCDSADSMWKSELSIVGVLLKVHGSESREIERDQEIEEEKKSDDVYHDYGFSSPESRKLHVDLRIEREPDVTSLSEKMNELADISRHKLNANGGRSDRSESETSSADNDKLFIGNTFSVDEHQQKAESTVTDQAQRKEMLSRYSLLFEDPSGSEKDESRDEKENSIRIWNEVDRIWEDVDGQLNSHPETFREDSQILKLKVDLAKQAKKLAELGRKVTSMRETGKNKEEKATREIYDLTHVFETKDTMTNARKLVYRLSDLEERLVCDEIKIQHLSMEAYTVEQEGDEMVNVVAHSKHKIPVVRDLSGISWGSNSEYRSFVRYEKDASRANRVVRFQEEPIKNNRSETAPSATTRPTTTPLFVPQRIVHASFSDSEATRSSDDGEIVYSTPEPIQVRAIGDSTEREGTIEIETSCSSYASSTDEIPRNVQADKEEDDAKRSVLLGPLPDLPSKPLLPVLDLDDAVTSDAVRSTCNADLFDVPKSEDIIPGFQKEGTIDKETEPQTMKTTWQSSTHDETAKEERSPLDMNVRLSHEESEAHLNLPQDPSGIIPSNISSYSSKVVLNSKASSTSQAKTSTEAVADSAKSSSGKPSTDAVAGDQTERTPEEDHLLNREIPALLPIVDESPTLVNSEQLDPLIEIVDSSSAATSSDVTSSYSFNVNAAKERRQKQTRYQKLAAAKMKRTRRFSKDSDTSSSLLPPSVKAGSFGPSAGRLGAQPERPYQSTNPFDGMEDTDSSSGLDGVVDGVFRPTSVTVDRLDQRDFSNLTSSHDSERQLSDIDDVIHKYTNEKLL